MNIASLVLERARSEPDAVAIRQPAGPRRAGPTRYATATHADLDRDSDALAHGLESIGVSLGVRTALMVRPSIDLFTIMLALFKLGVILEGTHARAHAAGQPSPMETTVPRLFAVAAAFARGQRT